MTGLGLSEQERWSEMQAYQNQTCEKWKRELMHQSECRCSASMCPFVYSADCRSLRDLVNAGPGIVFMLEHLQRNGSDVGPHNIVCEPCSTVRAGGFSPDAGAITICQERAPASNYSNESKLQT